jgi:hypothetical protein
MPALSVQRALARVQSALLGGDSPYACVAAVESGRTDRPAEPTIAGLVASQSPDGSWVDLDGTASALLVLAELDPRAAAPGVAPAVQEALAWLRSRRGGPGRFGEGCEAGRHADGLCHHFLGGFFGLDGVATGEPLADARLAASCRAERAVLRFADPGGDDQVHLDAARRLVERWSRWDDGYPRPTGYVAALGLLVAGPPDERRDRAARRGLALLATAQRGDGSWPEADTFAVLEVLDLADRAGRFGSAVGTVTAAAAALLAATQTDRGGWRRDAGPSDLLTAWRTLRRASGATEPPVPS